jgi:hypothetical protein
MEIGSRLPGVQIPDLWAKSLSLDPFKLVVRTFLGETHEKELNNLSFDKWFRLEFCGHATGIDRVETISGLDSIKKLSSYYNHSLSIEIDQKQKPSIDLATIPLLVRLLNSDEERLDADSEQCHRLFKIA